MLLQILPSLNKRLNNNLSSFKNEVTATILSFPTTLLHTKNQAPVTIPLMSTDCSIHHLRHLIPPSIPLLKHDQPWSLPLVLCAIDMVTRQSNASGMVLGFVPIAKKWDIPYTIATSFVETNNASIPIYCIV